ncbi:NADH-quinone oxidoreductase subunit J [Bacteriovorax sp. PP10]|uniref:NADH-quinone oxidoreductase subunit J n=1 Tax=Bacteriovorax antarcticus TaxID=3088717 RepID=A0ABU5VP02_9BACT|nr:NADH-quinone oxidoreductase subunit J [Bacteriovorax sp. PP10]MEA9354771.1 NADH-quinone oxidoreductase subunit J [Bacteriovorax sp. PP10]
MFGNTLFLLSAVLTLAGAFACVYSKNLMHSCIYLLASLFGVAGLYACLGADFLAATQLVVYAGGVIILMLFAIMLTGGTGNRVNRYGLEKIPAMGNKKTFMIAGFAAAVSALILAKILYSVFAAKTVATTGFNSPSVADIGTALATDHILAFEISSVLLLGALIGAAVISRPRKEIHD